MKNFILSTAAFFICICTFAQVPSYVPTNGLVGYWPFNGNANDESGNGNNGTVNGATLTSDRFGNVGKAYSFNGSNVITISNNATLNFQTNNSVSFSFWFKTDTNQLYRTPLIQKQTGGGNSQVGYNLGIDNGGFIGARSGIGLMSKNGASNQWGSASSDTSNNLTSNRWFHIVMTYTNGVGECYINGSLNRVITNQTGIIGDNLNPLLFGSTIFPAITSKNYIGQLDDIAIYNRALSQSEITSLYNANSCIANITTNDTTICRGSSVTLNASGSNQIQNITSLTREWTNSYSASIGIFKKALLFDSSLVISGSNWPSWPSGTTDQMITKIGTDGSLKWRNVRAPGPDHDGFNSVYRYPSGNLLFFGQENAQGTNYFDGFWTRFDANGNELNYGFFNVPGSSSGTDVIRLPNGNFAFSGPDPSPSTYVAITDSNLNQLRYVTYPSGDWFGSRLLCDSQYLYSVVCSNLSTFKFVKFDFSLNQIISLNLPNNVATTNSINDAILIDGFIFLVGNKVENGISYGVIYKLNTNGVIVDSYIDIDRSDYTALVGRNHKLFFAKSYLNSSGYSTLNKIIEFVGNGQIGLQYTMNNGATFCSTDLNMDDNYIYASGVAGPIYIGIPAVEKIKINYSSSTVDKTYLWSTGASTPSVTVTPLVTTTYYCTVSDVISSCIDSVTVTVNNLNTNLFTQDTIKACGASYSLNAGTGYASYLWNTGATTQTINAINTGWYKCTVSNRTCTGSDSVFVSIVNANIVNNDTTICNNNTVTLNVDYQQNIASNAIYNSGFPNPWPSGSLGNGGTIDLGVFSPQNVFSVSFWVKPETVQEGIGIILDCSHGGSNNWVIQTLNYGATWTWGSMTFTLTPNVWQHVLLTYDNGLRKLFINGNLITTLNQTINYSGNPRFYLGNWPEGGRRFRGYIDELYVTSSILRTSNFTPEIEIANPVANTIGLWHFNEGLDLSTLNSFTSQNHLLNNWVWSTRDLQTSNMTGSVLWSNSATTSSTTVSPTETTKYYVTVSNGISSCVDSVTVTVNIINANLFVQDTIRACGPSYSLNAGSSYNSYTWNTGASTQTINATNTGWYKCTLINGTCTGSDSVFVSIVDANIVNDDTLICRGAAVTLSATANATGVSSLSANLRNGLVGYWPFNGNAIDESGNGNNGVVNGAIIAADRNGYSNSAYHFDGTSSIEIITNTLNIASSQKTISLWVNYLIGYDYPCDPMDPICTSQTVFQIGDLELSKGYYPNRYSLTETIGFHQINEISVPNIVNWNHIVLTIDSNVIKTYINGVLSSNDIYSISNNNSNFIVGSSRLREGTPTVYWAGDIDDFAVWNRALNSNEVSQLNSGADYHWSNGATTSSISVSPTQTTTYYCTVSNGISSCTDSVTVYVKQPTSSTTNVSVCANQLPFVWNGTSYNAEGSYNKILMNAAGCDSIATLNLIVKATSTSSTNISVCSNQLPYLWNGISCSAAGTYNKNFTNTAGCDSIATLNLTVKSTSTSTTNTTACGSYVWNAVTYTSSGTYTKLSTNSVGCDSIATLNLTITSANNSAPSAIVGTRNINRCDTLRSYSVTAMAGVTFTWTVTGTGNSVKTGQGTNAIVMVMKVAGTISVKATNACGVVSTITTLAVTKAKPTTPGAISQSFIPATVAANTNTCLFTQSSFAITGVADTFRIRAVANATGYFWKAPTGSIITRVNDTTIAVVFSNSIVVPDSIKVYSLSSCDTSLSSRILLTKTVAAAAANILKTDGVTVAVTDVCPNVGGSVTYKVRKVATAISYNWTMTRGTKATITHINSLGVNDTAVIVNYLAGFTADSINVSCSNGCGTSAVKLLKLSAILLPPTPSKITASTSNFYPCPTNTVQYTVASPAATTAQSPKAVYRWTKPANTTITASNADSSVITIRFEANYAGGTVTVKCQTACGIQGTAKSQAFYYTPPTPTGIKSGSGSYNVCIGATVSFTSTDPVSGTTGENSTQTPVNMHHWTKPNFTSITSSTVDSGTISLLIQTGFTGGNVTAKCQSTCGVSGTAKSQALTHTACPRGTKNSNVNTGAIGLFDVNIFPNPTTSAFNLQISSTSSEAFAVKVLDVQGRLIKSLLVYATEINNIGNDLKSGVYMVEITQGKEKKTVRVVRY